MLRWTIRITYTTGDSFSSYTAVDELGVSWANLDVAKQALAWIKDRTDLENERRDFRSTMTHDDFAARLKALPCAPDEYYDVCMMVPLDDGTAHHISTFWLGYFERLHNAEIVPVGDHAVETGMKYVP